MNEPKMPDELAELDASLDEVARRVERGTDPGSTALPVVVAMLLLIVALVLPWTGSAPGWQIMAGAADFGLLPRLFTFTALGFGLLGSALALATRSWAVAWVCAAGCGFSVINGVWAIWSRQTGVPSGGAGPAIGLVLALLAIVALAACWTRIALRR